MTSANLNAAAAILNGGRARRLSGTDKSKIQVAGDSIVSHQLAVLQQRFESIAMAKNQSGVLAQRSIPCLSDRVGGLGPIDGIAAALAWSPQPWVFVVASDMPYLSLDLIDALLNFRGEEASIVGVVIEERAQPLFALYHRRVLPALDQCLVEGRLRASDLMRQPPPGVRVQLLPEAEVRQIDPELRSFQNLNTPEDVLTSGGRIE